jgi:hypothetical protein
VPVSERPIPVMRHQLWLMLLIVATISFSLVFACAAPFAAFGAAVAMTLSRRDALLMTATLWLANQLTGYTLVGYPLTANSAAWGPAIGIAAVLGTVGALWTVQRLAGARDVVRAVAALLVAFAVYEVALFVVAAALLGGVEMFAPAIVGQVFVTNVVALAGLYALNRLGAFLGLRRRAAQASASLSRSA